MDKDLFDLLPLSLLSMGPKAEGFLSSSFEGLFSVSAHWSAATEQD